MLIEQAETLVLAAIDGVSAPGSPACSALTQAFSTEKDRQAFSEILMPGRRTPSAGRTRVPGWIQSLYQPWVVVAREPVSVAAMHMCKCIEVSSCEQCGGNTCLCGGDPPCTIDAGSWPLCGCLGFDPCDSECAECVGPGCDIQM